VQHLYLIHHADALGPEVDPQRPLSSRGLEEANWMAAHAKARGCVPDVIWHSGKLRARQTGEVVLRACNLFASFKMIRGLSPGDPPEIVRDAIAGETRAIALVGHMPNIAALRALLTGDEEMFPLHGAVALASEDDGVTWKEIWRLKPK
jgi:phosphohistidine phosphatase